MHTQIIPKAVSSVLNLAISLREEVDKLSVQEVANLQHDCADASTSQLASKRIAAAMVNEACVASLAGR